jgi:hypothetical protein
MEVSSAGVAPEGPRCLSRYINWLRAEWSGDRKPIPIAERPKTRVCGLSFAGVAGSNPAGGMDVCVVCCTVKGEKAKPGQSGQRSTENNKKNCEDEIYRIRPDWPLGPFNLL